MSKAPMVEIQAEVTRQIRQHARSSMTTEVCGVLIGEVREGEGVVITAAIAGVNAAQAGTHVTFTQDTWEHIYKVKDVEYPEERIVGWYHSHPGFGVFLSEHDTFIQENFFSAAEQVAWVFDPHTDEEGCFGWIDGRIARLESIQVMDTGAPVEVAESRDLAAAKTADEEDEVDLDAKPSRKRVKAPAPWLRWLLSFAALLAVFILGIAVARALFPALYPLVMPMDAQTGQPLLRDTATGTPVYLDPQSGRYVMMDMRTGRLSFVDQKMLVKAQPPAEAAPAAPLQPATPAEKPAGKTPLEEKK